MFSTVLSGSETQTVYMAAGCSAWVWNYKGDISSQGHLAALLDTLSGPRGPFSLRCFGITCWDMTVAAKLQAWADMQV